MNEVQTYKKLIESEAIIKNNENFVGMGLWNIGNELKYIRDNKTYKEKSYSSFEEYAEKELNYSRRYVYDFIKIAETYNVQSIAQIGHLGVTKLITLATLEETKREEFIENNKVDEMTTREIKESVQDYKRNNNDIWKIVDEVYDENIYDIPIDKLKPFPNHEYYFWNMKGKNYLNFLTSIENNGVLSPIIITRDNMIVSGHQRVRACKDLGIDIIPARYLYTKNRQNRKLDDLLLSTFFSCNMHTRSNVFYLALAWQQLYFGSKEKADYYLQKFIDGNDLELDIWLEEAKEKIKALK